MLYGSGNHVFLYLIPRPTASNQSPHLLHCFTNTCSVTAFTWNDDLLAIAWADNDIELYELEGWEGVVEWKRTWKWHCYDSNLLAIKFQTFEKRCLITVGGYISLWEIKDKNNPPILWRSYSLLDGSHNLQHAHPSYRTKSRIRPTLWSFSKNGDFISCLHDKNVLTWCLSHASIEGIEVMYLAHDRGIHTIAWSPNDTCLLTWSTDHTRIFLWSPIASLQVSKMDSIELLHTFVQGPEERLAWCDVGFVVNNKAVVEADDACTTEDVGTIADTLHGAMSLHQHNDRSSEKCTSVVYALDADGGLLLWTVSSSFSVRLFKMQNGYLKQS